MAPRPGRALRRAGVAAVLAVGLAGCGAPELDESQVVATLRGELESRGVQADDLSCPGDLPADVGRSVRCSFTVGGQPVDAVATVTGVDGGTVTYDVRSEARPVARAVLERSVAEQLGRLGVALSDTACTDDLQARIGATVACRVTGADGTTDWIVRTTSVTGGKVDYSIEQAGLT
jgi:Domain of unknown function (DUF4333)